MSGFGGFLKRHRMMIIVPAVLVGEFYIWWQIQQNERYVPQNQKAEIFVHPLEYAKKLYGESTNDEHHHQQQQQQKQKTI